MSISSTLRELYSKYGELDYISEPITQLQHAIQCAELASREFSPDDVVIAAFLHDIGHLVGLRDGLPSMKGNIGTENHEIVGAEYLQQLGLSPLVCSLVRSHVSSKRYLAAKKDGFIERLSEGSKLSLIEQGGPMSVDECLKFEQEPYFKWYLKMRQWDDAGKIQVESSAEDYWKLIELNYG